jgi:capsule polysaccharide export protein KpsE/RkpR
MESGKASQLKFTDYLSVLLKWKKFILINFLIAAALATGISFLIPVTYKATTIIMIPPESSSGLGGLGGLLSGRSSSVSLGTKLFGLTSTSEDLLLGILNSRSALENVINKFGLMDYYKIDDRNFDKVLKAFKGDLFFETNEYGMIEISVINEDPGVSAQIANYFVGLLDSMNIKINIEAARNNRSFIEKRYLQNLSDLRLAEDSLFKFQKKYGIFAVPEQLEVSLKASAEIEAQLIQKQLMAELVKNQVGENAPQYSLIIEEVNLLKNKVDELKKSPQLSKESNILFPFSKIPGISLEWVRIYREIGLQSKLLEFIMPLYEQAKVEEQKSIPTIMVVDKAVPPQLKYAPKRSLIILGISIPFLFILMLIAFRGEKFQIFSQQRNNFEEKELKFFNRIKKIYRLKF